jgi:DNA-binding response OmpR family regulator
LAEILIVEDEPSINELIRRNLNLTGHHCTQAFGGLSALDLLEKGRYDLLVLDVMLPGLDGYKVFERVQGTPTIFLTAKSELTDKLKGLAMGADDYLTKPFQMLELAARVEAVLRRLGKGDRQLEFGDVSVQLSSRQVLKAGQPVVLTMKEFDLLVELMQNRNIALYREQLYEKVWKEPFTGAPDAGQPYPEAAEEAGLGG